MNNFLILKIKHPSLRQLFAIVIIDFYVISALFFQQQLFNGVLKSEYLLLVIGLFIISITIFEELSNDSFYRINSTKKLEFVLLLFIILDSLIIRERIMFGAIFDLFVGIAIAKQLNHLNRYFSLSLIPFWFLVFYIIYRLSITFNPEKVFINSRNYVSFYLIITVLPYYFLNSKNLKAASIFPALITFILSALSLGRSGILSSALILVIVIFFKTPKKLYKYRWLIIIFFLGSSFYVFFIYFKDLLNITSFSSRVISETSGKYNSLGHFVESGGRATIISDYSKSLNFFSFLFGSDLSHPTSAALRYVINRYGHLHSSLLNMYAAIGLGAIIFLGFVFHKLKYYYSQNKVLMFLLIAILLRSSTDVGLLFSYFDFVFWMFLVSVEFNKSPTNKGLDNSNTAY